MLINYGFDISIQVPQPTPLVTLLDIRDSRRGDVESEGAFVTNPDVPVTSYRDQFGNHCRRMVAPAGTFRFSLGGTVRDSGRPDMIAPELQEIPVPELPADVLVYLLG